MENFLVEDTPAKVLGFSFAAIFSMAFLFAVSASNASFQGSEYSLPNPFAPGKVVSVIDRAAASYSGVLADFTQPARAALAVHVQEMKWIMDEAAEPLASALGLEGPAVPSKEAPSKVAGAFTIAGSSDAFSVDTLYEMLIGY